MFQGGTDFSDFSDGFRGSYVQIKGIWLRGRHQLLRRVFLCPGARGERGKRPFRSLADQIQSRNFWAPRSHFLAPLVLLHTHCLHNRTERRRLRPHLTLIWLHLALVPSLCPLFHVAMEADANQNIAQVEADADQNIAYSQVDPEMQEPAATS